MSPRVTLDGWLNSPGHRRNLLRPGWRETGIHMRDVDRPLEGSDHSRVWVNLFGQR